MDFDRDAYTSNEAYLKEIDEDINMYLAIRNSLNDCNVSHRDDKLRRTTERINQLVRQRQELQRRLDHMRHGTPAEPLSRKRGFSSNSPSSPPDSASDGLRAGQPKSRRLTPAQPVASGFPAPPSDACLIDLTRYGSRHPSDM